ncbi:Zn(2)-C6 fungal-type domain-containing protein [Mycena indigotica]|uniref:Zn(2)-C6 fungal-type domain-containing protein n=1 Tax=Mycena indigotica TaxID=2126181 RepID=A0A8H6SD80_9AGAR|nr:Zn(2)-C6 fungal-type domain-containing protein [Mycena indigotica]KAF7296798.1 Zn(2)-C6 fungal-type domain-containing protein [Mycena indigotica]
MSSNDDRDGEAEGQRKKRRLGRACDLCRSRKIRCDGSQEENEACSTCIDMNVECTYLKKAAKRPPPRSTYIANLESRLQHSEAQLRALRSELSAGHIGSGSSSAASSPPTHINDTIMPGDTNGSLFMLRTTLQNLILPPPEPTAEDLEHIAMVKQFERLRVESNLSLPKDEVRFIGKSSGIALVHAAMDLKRKVGKDGDPRQADSHGVGGRDGAVMASRRMQFWTFRPWANTSVRTHNYTFPPIPLMNELVELYFANVNIYLPLLHRPTFEKNVRDGLFLSNDPFAGTVLLVCAVASRWHSDPRVGAPGGIGVGLDDRYGRGPVSYSELFSAADSPSTAAAYAALPRLHTPTPTESAQIAAASGGPGQGLACGWAWFDQVPPLANQMFGQTTLYDLQNASLAIQFLERAASPHICWNIVGTALRLAQDLGIHRRSARFEKHTVEREQFKRAFWVLVFQDRMLSSGMGRPCSMQYEDYDVDLPIECDDEYWEHPTHAFQQPAGVPSYVAFFNTMMGLNHILAVSLKILYSLAKFRDAFRGMGERWDENVVAELDSAMNNWRERVPAHLQWDPARTDPVFFDQSVAIQCAYTYVQILVHRPFIPMLRKSQSTTTLPALAICTSAARTCAHVVDVQMQRKGKVPVVFSFHAVFSSAIVLILNVWSGKRTAGGQVDIRSVDVHLANVRKCMAAIGLCEDRWQHAGMLGDLLVELTSVGQLRDHRQPSDREKGQSSEQTNGAPAGMADVDSSLFYQANAMPTAAAPIWDQYANGAPYNPLPDGGPPMAEFGHGDIEMLLDMSMIDRETAAIWANAPVGLELTDWGNYFGQQEIPAGGNQAGYEPGVGMPWR